MLDCAINAIIRPPRAVYRSAQLPSGVPVAGFGTVPRRALRFRNPRDQIIVGSYYADARARPSACVLYLHGSSSCQSEGVFLVPLFAPAGVAVFCFDFGGSGISGGRYISLGWFERADVLCAIAALRAAFGIERFALWGRSMGAATALLAMRDSGAVCAAVVDSPFRSLPVLLRELLRGFPIPAPARALALWYLRRRIRRRAGFSIAAVVPEAVAPECAAPLFVIHGSGDDFVSPEHSRRIFARYGGARKEIRVVAGNHGSRRPTAVVAEATEFVAQAIGVCIRVEGASQKIAAVMQHFSPFEAQIRMEKGAGQ